MEKIKQKVKDIISLYKTADPLEICEKMGIIILEQELPDHVNGFMLNYLESRFIIINCNRDDYEKRITIAHELGHIIMHSTTNSIRLSCNTSFCVSKYEKEADYFAAYILMELEMSSFEEFESVTTRDISKIIHMPQSMVDKIFSEGIQ